MKHRTSRTPRIRATWPALGLLLLCAPLRASAPREPHVQDPHDHDHAHGDGHGHDHDHATERGEPAPPLVAERWFNAPADRTPGLEALLGETVVVEFWGTSLKQCMKTVPHAQAFHDRYGELGLRVMAISYDTPEVLSKLIETRGYSIPIGVDTEMKNYAEWNVPEVPTVALIDATGRVIYYGPPEGCDLEIEAELGLEVSATSLLDAYLVSSDSEEAAKERHDLLARLIAKAPRGFSLSNWAARRCEEVPEPAAEGAQPLDVSAALTEYATASMSGDDERRTALLERIAAAQANDFDLKAWTRAELARLEPFDLEEAEGLLAGGRQEQVLEALLFRAPTPEARQRAAADPRFVKHCASATLEARSFARQGLLAQYWLFPEVEPVSAQRFWSDLGIGGPSLGQERITVLSIGVERVDARSIASFVDEQVLRYLVASSYASHRAVDPLALEPQVRRERDRLLRQLVDRHGGVELGDQ